MSRIVVGLPLACDYIPTNVPLSELEKSPSVRRINACLKGLKEMSPKPDITLIVLTAGYTKASPREMPEQGGPRTPLCDQMSHYITAVEWRNFSGIFSAPLGWGTEAEIKNGIEVMQAALDKEEVTLVVSTNLAHLFRTAVYVWKYLPKGWDVWIVRAKHDFSFKSCLREIPGFFHALFFTLKFKLLGK